MAAMPRHLLASRHQEYQQRYETLRAQRLTLSMARGIPAPEQVKLSERLLSLPGEHDFMADGGVDCRNYTGLQGLAEARKLFSPMVGVPPEQVIVGGNSSLAFIYDCIGYAWRHGVCDSPRPWGKEKRVAFLCPVPGYDRHFRIAEEYGIELIPVPLLENGPDMDIVRKLVATDDGIKGMWCVPKYSNPTGTVYAPEIVEALASMKTAAADFRLFWDNAYAVHHLTDDEEELANIVTRCSVHGHPDRALVFASTSKITLPGAGVALFGSSARNVEWALKRLGVHTVGPDKINQLRHVRFLSNGEGIKNLMAQHRAIMAPKFAQVSSTFQRELSGLGIAEWTDPKGGYFISLEVLPGCAKRVVQLAAEAGIALTPAGAPFPGGRDPRDSNIRIAPSFLTLQQVSTAAQAITDCVLLAAAERLLKPEEK